MFQMHFNRVGATTIEATAYTSTLKYTHNYCWPVVCTIIANRSRTWIRWDTDSYCCTEVDHYSNYWRY